MQVVTDFFFNVLAFFYASTGNLGIAIIVFTFVVRAILLPLSLPSIKAQKKIRELQPELKKLKEKHGKNKQALQMAQMELYRKYNVNPLAGCIPQVAQIIILIFLYQGLDRFLGMTEINGLPVNTNFLWLNLSNPDNLYVIPVLAAVTQFVLSMMILPATEIKDEVPNQSRNKKVVAANKKEEDVAEMAATMQQQMMFIMPLMTGFFALRFPSGLGLYWTVTTVFTIAQQYFLSGPGGLVTYWQRFRMLLAKRFGGATN